MPDARPQIDAELEAGAQALADYLESICVDPAVVHPYAATGAVLDAVLPDRDARVRADERARVAEELLAAGRDPHQNLAWMYPEQAAAIARQHATPPTTEHRCTDLADWHGGYQCTCGELWLIGADRCMTQPAPPATEEPTCA